MTRYSLGMRAIHIERHGPPESAVVREIPDPPAPGADQVVVEVEAAGVNPSDGASVHGAFPGAPLPRIVGRDFAGRVVAGPAELAGAAVWGSGGDLGISRDGTFAQLIVLRRDEVARRPAVLSAEQAAAAGVPYVTAWSALELAEVGPGSWVIVAGAAGAVGTAAVQLAAARGAKAIALVRRAETPLPRGASGLASVERDDLAEVVRELTGGRGCDAALNGVGASVFQQLLDALADRGRQVIYSILGGRETSVDLFRLYRRNQSLRGLSTTLIDAAAGARILAGVAPLFDDGRLEPPRVAARFSLDELAAALATRGKTVLVP